MVNPIANTPPAQNMPKPGMVQQKPAPQHAPVDQTRPMMPNQAKPNIQQAQVQQPQQQVQQPQQQAANPAAGQAAGQQVAKKEQQKEVKQAVNKKVEQQAVNGIKEKSQEKELVKNMKKTIEDESKRVSRKVNRSALKYMLKNTDWISEDKAAEAEEFLTIKVPKVLSDELTHILSDVLGLEQVQE